MAMGNRASLFVFPFLLALSLPACVLTPRTGVEVPTPDPQGLLSSLTEQQNNITSFRGIGKLCYTVEGEQRTTRVAWIGSSPGNLRIETLGLWGQPNLTLLIKGSTLYLHVPDENRCLQAKATANNVSRLVSVPLPVEDLFVMLSGQVPIRPFHRAEIQFSEIEGDWCLSLYGKWRRIVERMWTEGIATEVNRIDVFDGRGHLLYTALFKRFQPPEDSLILKEIVVSGEQGASFSLELERLSTNVEVPAGAYTLQVTCGSNDGP